MIKWLRLSAQLFIKRPFANVVLAVQLAIVAWMVLMVSNICTYNASMTRTIADSPQRVVYCMRFNPLEEGGGAAFQKLLDGVVAKYPAALGHSNLMQCWNLYEDKDDLLANGSNASSIYTMVVDPATITALPLPIAHGKWITSEPVDGRIPCVVGGKDAGKYRLGQTISGYTYDLLKVQGGVPLTESALLPIEAVITGILDRPEIFYSLTSSQGNAPPAAHLFSDLSAVPLFMVFPDNLYPGFRAETNMNAFLYLEKDCPEAELEAIRAELGGYSLVTDTQILQATEQENKQMLNLMMPYILLLGVVCISGMLAISMLTTIQNMETLKAYYLVGCPKYKILLMLFAYILFYFLIGAVFFLVVYLALQNGLLNAFRMTSAYMAVTSQALTVMGLVCLAVSVLSMIIPMVLLKKADLIGSLRGN